MASIIGPTNPQLSNMGFSPEQIAAVMNPTGASSGMIAPAAGNPAPGPVMPMAQPAAAQPGMGYAGAASGNPQNNAFNSYLDSTGYGFQFDQGQRAITGSAAAKGLLNSGATAKALTKYGQNIGKQYFSDYLGQLGNMNNILGGTASAGQNALGQIATVGTAGGGNAASAITQGASNQGASVMAGGNAMGNAISTAGGALGNAFANIGGSMGSGFFGGGGTPGSGGLY